MPCSELRLGFHANFFLLGLLDVVEYVITTWCNSCGIHEGCVSTDDWSSIKVAK